MVPLRRSLDFPHETKQDSISQQVSLGTHFATLFLKSLIHWKHAISSPSIKTYSKWLVRKQRGPQAHVPRQPTTSESTCTRKMDHVRLCYGVFYQKSSACLAAGEQQGCTVCRVACLLGWVWHDTPRWTPLTHAQPAAYLWVQTWSLSKEQRQREEAQSLQAQQWEEIPYPASYT